MTTGRFLGARWLAIALVAALGLTLSVSVLSAGASGQRGAVAAKKKKCKAKKGAAISKKKKCRHKLSIPGPIVRATISWPAGQGEVDLHAFDAAGNRSGIAFPCSASPCPITEGIPNATHSPDANNGGSETFTDNIFVKGGRANREFSYAVCFYANTTVVFTGVNRLGQSQSIPITDGPGGGHSLTVTGGPGVPASFGCPAVSA
jgi:hypothetical protein